MGTGIIRLCQVRATMISRATKSARTSGKAKSTAATSQIGANWKGRFRPLPSIHKSASPARVRPLIGGRPVKLATAVRTNPAIAAITKPKRISWMCQSTADRLHDSDRTENNAKIQIPSASTIPTPPRQKKDHTDTEDPENEDTRKN